MMMMMMMMMMMITMAILPNSKIDLQIQTLIIQYYW